MDVYHGCGLSRALWNSMHTGVAAGPSILFHDLVPKIRYWICASAFAQWLENHLVWSLSPLSHHLININYMELTASYGLGISVTSLFWWKVSFTLSLSLVFFVLSSLTLYPSLLNSEKGWWGFSPCHHVVLCQLWCPVASWKEKCQGLGALCLSSVLMGPFVWCHTQ